MNNEFSQDELFAIAVEEIQSGNIPDVVDASYSRGHVCIGDFRKNGWSEKIVTRRSMYWHWTGPGAIRVSGKIIQSNSYTEEIEMDWT